MTAQAPSLDDPRAAHAVVDTLIGAGIETVYCLPGYQNDWFFNAVHDAGGALRAVHTRHEQGAAYMATGAALATGQAQVYSVVPGPGVLNTAAALVTADAVNAPVLCLTGQIPSRAIGKGYGLLHEIPDQLGVLERLARGAERAARPEEAAPAVARALAALTRGRPGPRAVEIPPDILSAAGAYPAARLPQAPAGPEADAGAVAEAARLIAGAARPLIVVGGGALGASAEVSALARETGAPVYSYRMGRGVVDDREPFSLTLPAARHYWAECDVVIGIGTRLQGPVQGWGTDEAMRFVRIEVDPEEMTRIVAPDAPILARAEEAVPLLRAELARIGAAPADTADTVAEARAKGAREMAVLEPQLSFLAAIRAALGEDGVLVDDLTQVGYVSRFGFPVYRPRSYICSGYQGTLGSGFATALGAQHARPDLPMVSINGDGGFLFAVGELATAAHHGIPLVTVVFDDGAYGNVKRMQQELYGGREIASTLTNPDFVALGRAFGVETARAESPESLRTAVERLLARRAPALVHVPVGPMPDPFKFLMAPKIRG